MLIAVGGHSRNIGKTSVVCGIIAALQERNWQAFKITQHGHNVCANDGHPCGCAPTDPAHRYAIDQQLDADSTDTGRFLRAGAARSWWVRTAQGDLGHALGDLKRLFAEAEHNIVESNSLLHFVKPDLYIAVLDYAVTDMKDSARLFLDRADALVIQSHEQNVGPWHGVPERWIRNKPAFPAVPGETIAPELAAFLRSTVH